MGALLRTYVLVSVVVQVVLAKIFEGSSARIVGGEVVASTDEFPFVASIRNRYGSHVCVGTLIEPRVVLTSASCVTQGNLSEAWLGGLNRSDERSFLEIHRIGRAHAHDDYSKYPLYRNNIGLISLRSPSKISPVLINSKSSLDVGGVIATAVDWTDQRANQSIDNLVLSELLLKGEVPMVDFADCVAYWNMASVAIGDGMICAGSLDGSKRHCSWGYGAPLMVAQGTEGSLQWFQTGISNFFDPKCTTPCKVPVYTQVRAYQCWIVITMIEVFGLDIDRGGCPIDGRPMPTETPAATATSLPLPPSPTTGPTPIPAKTCPVASSREPSPSSSHLPPGAIAGIVIAILVIVLGIICAIVAAIIFRSRRTPPTEEATPAITADDTDWSYIRSGTGALNEHAGSFDFTGLVPSQDGDFRLSSLTTMTHGESGNSDDLVGPALGPGPENDR